MTHSVGFHAAGGGSATVVTKVPDIAQRSFYRAKVLTAAWSIPSNDSLVFTTEHNSPGGGLNLYGGTAAGAATSSTLIRDGNWHHVVWTYDMATTSATFYTDGVGIATGSYAGARDILLDSVRLGNRSGDGGGGQVGRLIDGVYIYDHALSQGEVDQLIIDTSPPSVIVPQLTVVRNGVNLDFSWNSQEGVLYDLVNSPDLVTPVATWSVVDSNEAIPADPSGTNTLSIVRLGDAKTFYSLAVYLAPPTVLFGSDFEADDGGMTFVDNSGGTGTIWEWGTPDPANGVGRVVTEGNGASVKCWATGLGDFTATADNGFYDASSNASLRTQVFLVLVTRPLNLPVPDHSGAGGSFLRLAQIGPAGLVLRRAPRGKWPIASNHETRGGMARVPCASRQLFNT